MVTALGWLLALVIAGWLFARSLAVAARDVECGCGGFTDPRDPCGLCPDCRRRAAIADGACRLCADHPAVDDGLCAGCADVFHLEYGDDR